MGYDISFHPIDLRVVEERITPYLAGLDGEIDDLVADAVRQAKVRFRANAWGLGTSKAAGDRDFDTFLYIWGRPFFVTAQDPAMVAETVVRYCHSSVDEVDDLAREQIALLDPGLVKHVEPDMTGTLPADAHLAEGFRWKLDLLRAAALAVREGRSTIPNADGDEIPAAEALTGNVHFAMVEFLAALLPGWIERGKVWPTELAGRAAVDAYPPIDDNAPLLGCLPTELPTLRWESESMIGGNYTIGGYTAPDEVHALRQWLARNTEPLTAVGDQWDDRPYVQGALRKIDEALALAELTGSGFVEAAEIYIPMQGTMN
ncbi:hypothetical protein IRT45_35170 [Nocardia sp. BSTN01]|uniref:hypothetical protein n=1 Tax=Nocardia sp. BSTN01 TaxID=2783665 RepID=UPI00189047A7|nr:hypothetical protein [Nocardia sp. BSTN01]MBF5002360.1 hypothetical protein [Nocardia sp. BSTN01]